MSNAYHGRILWANLGDRSFREEELPESTYRDFLGGLGLGVKVLWDNMPGGVDPLGPESILGFVPGLLTDTGAIFTGRYMVVGKSPLTGTWGDANSGGYFGPALKRTGFDGIFITGQSPDLLYILVGDGEYAFKDAAHLAGYNPEQTDAAISEELDDTKVHVASIGPAGEKLSLISCIINDAGRAAGRSGMGAVMGAKGLKALAVRGNSRVDVHDRARIKTLNKIYTDALKAGPDPINKTLIGNIQPMAKVIRRLPVHMRNEQEQYREILHRFGTSGAFTLGIETGDTPSRNFEGISYLDFDQKTKANKLDGKALVKYQTKKYHCQSCPLGCGGTVSVPEGKYKLEKSHKPEYETLAAFGSLCMNADLESIIMMNHICNAAGFDTISAGVVVAFAIECYERGILKPEDTGGLDLKWGNADAIIALLKKMTDREGIGDLLADGVKVASEKIGHGSEQFAMHAAGQEIPMHDPRQDVGWALAYVAEPTPGRHTAQSDTYYEMARLHKKFPELAAAPMFKLKSSKYKYSGDGTTHAVTSKWLQALSSAGLCMFGSLTGEIPLEEQLAAATGWDVEPKDWMTAGHRIQTLRQCFNIREGFLPSSVTVPERVLAKQAKGPSKNASVDIEAMRKGFYRALQWDEGTGVPTEICLTSLGLDGVHAQIASKVAAMAEKA